MKRIMLVIFTALLCISIIGCTKKDEQIKEPAQVKENVTFDVYGLAGPTSMGMAKIINDKITYSNLTTNIKYDFKVEGSPDVVVSKILNGEAEIAAIPTNVASIIYNKTGGKYKLGAVNTLGILYLLGNKNSNVTNWSDLKGKTIYLSGKGATPDYVLRYLLQKNGLNPDTDVTIEYAVDHATVGQMLLTGKTEFALVPQPFVTNLITKKPTLKTVFDMNAEWKKVTNDAELPMGCIVIKTETMEKYKDAVDDFMKKYEESVIWVNSNTDMAGQIIAGLKILPDAKVAKNAIPMSKIVFVKDNDSRVMLEKYFSIMNQYDAKTIGGKLPNETFYNIKK